MVDTQVGSPSDGTERCAGGSTCYSLGCLGQAGLQHLEDLRLVDSLGDVEHAGGGWSPLAPEEVEGGVRALALGHVILSRFQVLSDRDHAPHVPVLARHVSPHVEGQNVASDG